MEKLENANQYKFGVNKFFKTELFFMNQEKVNGKIKEQNTDSQICFKYGQGILLLDDELFGA